MALTCKLSTPEFQHRKSTVLAELKTRIRSAEETAEGFRYSWSGTDQMLDTLLDFIKAERQCCDFFKFELAIGTPADDIWLSLSGPPGAKEFIRNELGLQ
jgi:hypothetical protein